MNKLKLKSGIYKITINDYYIYIGQSRDIKSRWSSHLSELKQNRHCNRKLQNVFNKYPDSIKFEIIEECDVDKLNKREAFYIEQLNTFNSDHGLNMSIGGDCGSRKYKTREEAKVAALEQTKQWYQDNKKELKVKSKRWYKNNREYCKQRAKERYQDNKDRCKEYYKNNKEKLRQRYQDKKDDIREHNKQYYQDNKDKIKEYYQYNKDKINQRAKQYYQDNKDKIKEYRKQYRQDNKDKIKEYRKTHKEEIKQYCEEYRKTHKEEIKQWSKQRYQDIKKQKGILSRKEKFENRYNLSRPLTNEEWNIWCNTKYTSKLYAIKFLKTLPDLTFVIA